jgi:hypothetical protein
MKYEGIIKVWQISYLARENRKGGDEDIAKAIHHLTALMDLLHV